MEERMSQILAQLTEMDAQRAALERELNDLKLKNIGKLDAATKAEATATLKNRSKQFVTAQSARQTAENTAAVKNHIAKFIQEESKEGRTQLNFCTCYLCDVQLNSVVEELSALGYDVDLNTEDNELVIKW